MKVRKSRTFFVLGIDAFAFGLFIYCRQDNPVKPYFRAIRNDLYEGVDQFYEKLSALAKKQA